MARPRTICLLLALITVLVYSPVRHAAFVVFDDPDYIGNSHVQAGLTWAGVKWAFTTWQASNWHPLTWLSHMLDASFFGPNPGAQHFVNAIFHTANTILLFLLLLRATNKPWPAAFVAALFAWHPLHVESVAWVSERKDVLSTFFGLLTLLAYVRYAEEAEHQSTTSKTWLLRTLIFFILGLLSKPILVTLPFVMLLLDIWPLGRFDLFAADNTDHGLPRRSAAEAGTRNAKFLALFAEKIPFFVLTIASCIVTFLAQRGEAVMSFEQRSFSLRVENAIVAYVEYLAKTIWPARLAVIYPLPNEVPVWQIIGAAAILVGITVLVWLLRRRAPYYLIGWLWFLGTLVPVIGIIQVGGQALADRYTYIPLIGIFIAIAYAASDLMARFKFNTALVSGVAALSLVACIATTEWQLTFWQSSEALFRHAIELTKNNAVAYINLGVAYEQEDRREDALAQYHKALEIDPNRFQAHNNLANLLSDMGERDEAAREYQAALRLNPNAAPAHLNFGTLLSDMGRFDDAMSEYSTAARLAPDDYRVQYLMGKACLRRDLSAEAVKHFRTGLQLAPNDFQTLTWLARVLAADKDPSVRNAAGAVSFAQRASDLTGAAQPFVLDTLAMAYAEAGRFQDAQQSVQKAIDLAATGAKDMVPALQNRLRLYQSGQPYREDFTQKPTGSK
jgi:tetratricopeptide (TPR) repeat protein